MTISRTTLPGFNALSNYQTGREGGSPNIFYVNSCGEVKTEVKLSLSISTIWEAVKKCFSWNDYSARSVIKKLDVFFEDKFALTEWSGKLEDEHKIANLGVAAKALRTFQKSLQTKSGEHSAELAKKYAAEIRSLDDLINKIESKIPKPAAVHTITPAPQPLVAAVPPVAPAQTPQPLVAAAPTQKSSSVAKKQKGTLTSAKAYRELLISGQISGRESYQRYFKEGKSITVELVTDHYEVTVENKTGKKKTSEHRLHYGSGDAFSVAGNIKIQYA